MGVVLKSNVPKICAYTNNLGFVLDVRSNFIVISDCFTIRHLLSSTDANPATKCSFYVCISRSAVFILWVCGGASFTTVILFCKSCVNAAGASLSIIFNFGACPPFSNVSYKTSYARNMYVSILVLMVSTKISFVSYTYSINMYCIPLLLVTGKCPVKSVHTFPVTGSARPMAINKEFVFSPLRGKNMFPSPVLVAHYLLTWCFFAFDPNFQK